MAELRVMDLDDSVGSLDVIKAITLVGGCSAEDIKLGSMNRAPNGLGSIWLRCPLAAVNKVSQGGRVQVDWCRARVSLLDARPLQCYRCLEVGHVQANCRNKKDRRGQCYRCGQEGHLARECDAVSPNCAVCADEGRPANHRARGKACPHVRNRRNIPISRAKLIPSKTSTMQAVQAGKTSRPRDTEQEVSEGSNGSKRRREEEKEVTVSPPPADSLAVAEEVEAMVNEVEMREEGVTEPALATPSVVDATEKEGRGGEEKPLTGL